MLSLESAMRGDAIPVVDAEDLRRVWAQMSVIGAPNTSICTELLSQQCTSASADVIAVALRALFIKIVLDEGLLENYQDGETLRAIVFEKAAILPLPTGLQAFDAEKFLETLTSST